MSIKFTLAWATIFPVVGVIGYNLLSDELRRRDAGDKAFQAHVADTAASVRAFIQESAAGSGAAPPDFRQLDRPTRYTLLDNPGRPFRIRDRKVVVLTGVSEEICKALGKDRLPGTVGVSVDGGEPTTVAEPTRCEANRWFLGNTVVYPNTMIVVLGKESES